jgi:periplasmic divalent cation tolerance protein
MAMIGWTTVSSREQAETLAVGLIESRLAACVQIDGPVTSVYRWNGNVERAAEFRIWVKFIDARQADVEAWIFARHPYETPEWMTFRTENVSEKYLSWMEASSSN